MAHWKVAKPAAYSFHFPKTKEYSNIHGWLKSQLRRFGKTPDSHPFVSSKNFIKMKKVYLAILAVFLNMFLFSCTKEDVADTETLYHTVATEGDDSNPPPPPPPPPPPGE